MKLLPVIDDDEWDSFLRKSEQFSIYLTSDFLHCSDLDRYRYFLYENDKPLLGCLLPPRTINGMNAVGYCMYQGLFFIEKLKGNYADELDRVQKLSKLSTLLLDLNMSISLSLHHSVFDIRGIEWSLYENGKSSRMQYAVRYSGIIHLKNFSDFQSYRKSIRKVRLQEFSNSNKKGFILNTQPDTSVFMKMYEEMFTRRGIKLGKSELHRVFSIINFGVKSGVGRLFILHHENGTPISGVFILTDGTTDYYQFGASNAEMLKVSGSSYLLLHAIEQAFINGRKYFDMVGMNSPSRGDFKASFNAKVTPYFEIEFLENNEGK